jgi:hypothetical protein
MNLLTFGVPLVLSYSEYRTGDEEPYRLLLRVRSAARVLNELGTQQKTLWKLQLCSLSVESEATRRLPRQRVILQAREDTCG